MTRNNFFKRLGVLAAIVALSPLELLKGKEKNNFATAVKPNDYDGYLPTVKKYGASNSVLVSDTGSVEWKNWEGFEGEIEKGDLKEFQRVCQYPLTEDERYKEYFLERDRKFFLSK